MDCKKRTAGRLMCAVAAGVIAMAPIAARAMQDNTTGGTTTGGTATGGAMTAADSTSTMVSSTPTQVSGTVLRYYVDRAGYVTAMDVQTANGVQMVRFSPGMGQRVFSTYPVGGQANVWVSGSGSGSTARWDVVGIGTEMPAHLMSPYTVSDVALLDAEPYIQAGTTMTTISGKLRNIVTNDVGEVVGLVLGDASGGMTGNVMGAETGTSMSGGAMMAGMSGGDILVRVPRNMRHISPGHMGSERITPLFKNAMVWVTGYPEAPRYGVLSRYGQRLAASAIVVNGRAVGPLGFPLMSKDQNRTLFAFDLGRTQSPEEANAETMGYSVYDPSGMGAGTSSMGGTGTTPGSGTTTTTPGG